jgi:hypothetical protein
MDIEWSDEQLRAAGVPKRRLAALVRKLRECSETMRQLGLTVYGVDGSGHLVHDSRPEHDSQGRADFGAIVARVGYGFNGGGW